MEELCKDTKKREREKRIAKQGRKFDLKKKVIQTYNDDSDRKGGRRMGMEEQGRIRD